jgi:uncharacterized phage-associated protein
VAERYGAFTGKDLVRVTHAEAPWRDVSETDDPGTVSDAETTHAAMRDWRWSGLAATGRATGDS